MPRTRLKTIGDKAFSIVAPGLSSSDSVEHFNNQLHVKTFFFLVINYFDVLISNVFVFFCIALYDQYFERCYINTVLLENPPLKLDYDFKSFLAALRELYY